MKPLVCTLLSVSFFFVVPTLFGDEPHRRSHDVPGSLGKVSFPISCSFRVQKSFERGVALLHSFGYEEAEAQFSDLARQDHGCAMAHWGVAMSLFHQIWDRPDAAVLKRGSQEIEKAQKTGAKTARERGYISALAAFYSNPSSADHEARAAAYSDAMSKLYQQNPNDVEAGAFYALSLLAAQPAKDISLAPSKKAIEILNKLFQQNPEHPGLAHYIIHSCDSPELAPLGLEAARRYAQIAPASAHALHMPSHIFARLGLWQEDIQANLKSVASAQHAHAAYMHGHELHAMHFLIYAYLQTGRDQAAQRILEDLRQIVANAPPASSEEAGMMRYFAVASAHFPALYQLEMRRWPDAMALEPPRDAPSHIKSITYWARTLGAAHMGDVEAVRRNSQEFDALQEATRKSKYAYVIEGPNFPRDEVHAWLAFAEKKNDEALRLMRQVADAQDRVGKAEVDIPAREMLADMLLELGQPEQALAEYEQAMKIDPNRFNGLSGAARAAELAHQTEKANTYYTQLLKNCDNGKNSARPELAHARTLLAGNVQ